MNIITRVRNVAKNLRTNYRASGFVVFYAFLAGCLLGHNGPSASFFIAAGFAAIIPLVDAALIVWHDHELAKLDAVQSILDANYSHRDVALAESAVRKLERSRK